MRPWKNELVLDTLLCQMYNGIRVSEVIFVVTGCQFRLIGCQEVPQELSKQASSIEELEGSGSGSGSPAGLSSGSGSAPQVMTMTRPGKGHTHASTNNSFHVILKMFFSAWPLVISFRRQNLPGDFINYHKFESYIIMTCAVFNNMCRVANSACTPWLL